MIPYVYCPKCATTLVNDTEDRPTCPSGHFTQYPTPVTTALAIIHNKGEFLILERAREPHKGGWALPGGFMEPNETGLTTVMREIDEETQLKNLNHIKLMGTFPSNYGGIEDTLALGYLVDSDDRNVVLSEEHTNARWVSINNVPEFAFADCNLAFTYLKNRPHLVQ